jgi:hypothetical protein
MPRYYPIFANEPLGDWQTFSIRVMNAAKGFFMIGVATDDLRDQTDKFQHINSICLKSKNGKFFLYGMIQKYRLKFETGDRVTVKRK